MIYLIYFDTLIIVCFILIYYLHKILNEHKLKNLQLSWNNNKKQYNIDLELKGKQLKEKLENYLEEYLRKECFNCRTFDKNANDDYFCIVDGQCPGIDLRYSQKIDIIRNREYYFNFL